VNCVTLSPTIREAVKKMLRLRNKAMRTFLNKTGTYEAFLDGKYISIFLFGNEE